MIDISIIATGYCYTATTKLKNCNTQARLTKISRVPSMEYTVKEYNLSTQADVIEVGPMVKYVKPGDVVYYREACQVPVPFFGQGLYVVSEHQIHVVINAGVKERFEKINKEEK